MSNNDLSIARAIAISAHQAVGQKRKYDGTPYYHHPLRVAEAVAENGGTVNQIAAALLHDVVEDTAITLSDLVTLLTESGYTESYIPIVVRMVNSLTDVFVAGTGINREWRQASEIVRHRNNKTTAFWLIKLCDLNDNLDSIEKYDQGYLPVFLSHVYPLYEAVPRCGQEYQIYKRLGKRFETYDRLFNFTNHPKTHVFRDKIRAITEILPPVFTVQDVKTLVLHGAPTYDDRN